MNRESHLRTQNGLRIIGTMRAAVQRIKDERTKYRPKSKRRLT